jgi:phenylacetate-CoA ligase
MDIFGYREWLGRTAGWSQDKRAQWRIERLNEMLRFCWNEVPFYRQFWADHGVSAAPLGAVEELEAYPIVTKDLFRQNYERLQPVSGAKIPHKVCRTGGTTGEPVQYCQDLGLHSVREAFGLWAYERAGYRFGDPITILAGHRLLPDLEKPLSRGRLRLVLRRVLPLLGVHMDGELARQYRDRMVAHGTRFLCGYPSCLSEFASCLSRDGLGLPGLKGAFTTSEMLQLADRRMIEECFGCPVWDEYSCNDGGISAYECSLHDGHHYNDLEAIAESVDRQENGGGKLLITNLWNRSTPFIRYENGDQVLLGEGACSCDWSFPRIESLQGRVTDRLAFASGRVLLGPSIVHIFHEMPDFGEIQAFQVVQRSPKRVEVRLRAPSGVGETNKSFIRRVFAFHAGEDVEVDIRTVGELHRSPGGKLKYVWVEFDEAALASPAPE